MPSGIQGGGNSSPSRLLTAAFRLMGKFPTFVDEIIVGVVKVADLSEAGPRPLVRRAQNQFSQAAVAGQVVAWRLELPAGIYGRIRGLYVNCAAATFCNIGLGATMAVLANTSATKQFQEGRLRVANEQPAGVLTFGTNAAGIVLPSMRVPAAAAGGLLLPLDLLFGREDAFDFVEFAVGAVNQTTFVGIVWDESTAL